MPFLTKKTLNLFFISNVNFEALLLKIPVWIFFFTLWCEFAYLGFIINMKRDLISSVMRACSSLDQCCGRKPASVDWFLQPCRCDHSSGSSTLTDSSRSWPYDKPGEPQEDVGFQPFCCSSYFQTCTHVIHTQEAISLQLSLHHSNNFCFGTHRSAGAGVHVSCEGSVFSPNTHFSCQRNGKPKGHSSIERIHPDFSASLEKT